MLYSKLTGKIIKAYYKVYNELGYGFLEKGYENALRTELRKQELKCVSLFPNEVYYEGALVGEYFADLFVEGKIILELKAAERISKAHELQLINYLRATEAEIGLLLNFGKNRNLKEKFIATVIKISNFPLDRFYLRSFYS
jgi:GxxExxY protein